MKRIHAALGIAAASITLAAAPAAQASTASRLAKLERHDQSQERALRRLSEALRSARAEARTANAAVAHLYGCVKAQPVGIAKALSPDTLAVFQAPDRFFYNAVTLPVLTSGGSQYVAFLDTACVGLTDTSTGPLFPTAEK